MRGHDQLLSSGNDFWESPRDLFERLAAEFYFAVDLAANESNTLCDLWVGPNGLHEDLLSVKLRPDVVQQLVSTHGCFWMNPPYSQCQAFIEAAHWIASRLNRTVVILVPARTDTGWWHTYVWNEKTHAPRPGVELRLLKGRLVFTEGGLPRRSLCAKGKKDIESCQMCAKQGGHITAATFPSAVIVFKGRACQLPITK